MSLSKTITEQIKNSLLDSLKKELENCHDEKEAESVLYRFKALDLNALFGDLLEEATNITVSTIMDTMFEDVIRYRADEEEFLARLDQKWYRPFAVSEEMYIMTLEAAEHYSKYVKSLSSEVVNPKKCQYTALRFLHGRAMQVYLEVITLMKGGLADGANARWRTLYELTIVAWFIRDQGEKVAQEYYKSQYSNQHYEWARVSKLWNSNKKQITFSDIERKATIVTKPWKEIYSRACKNIHASSQATFGRLGDPGNKPVISVGRSDYGFHIPGVNAAISLAQISAALFSLFSEEEAIIAMKSLQQWIVIVEEEYYKTCDSLFPDYEDKQRYESDCVSANT